VDAQNPPFRTEIRPYGKTAIAEAARLVLQGLAVAVPTETVYGLAADATSDAAVARIYEAKGRPDFNPLIVHVRDLAQAEAIADLPDAAKVLAEAYWPGALTMVVPRKAHSPVSMKATAGLPTVALRCPSHPAMRDLLAACGRPLAAPSANESGGISPTAADHVLKSLDARIPLIIDAGRTEHGIESTIVGFDEQGMRLLRPGPVDFAVLAALVRLSESAASEKIEAPGQLRSHYAPSKPLRLEATIAEPGEWLIGFGAVSGNDTLSASGDLAEAAARLFHALHRAESQAAPRIAVAPIPHQGVGAAINDRLKRAAAPR